MALSGSSWGTREELLHPRDKRGRFRRKWSLPTGTVDKIMAVLDAFQPKSFGSQQQASQWAFNQSAKKGPNKFQDFARLGSDYANTNADLRTGKMTPSTQKFVSAYDKASFVSDEDIVVYRKVGPEAFGISPEMMASEEGGIEDVLTGTTIVDKGYTSGNVGAPIGNAPITMAIAVPKGTKMMAPARSQGDPQVILDRDQKVHVSKVEPDGRGGYNVMAVLTDEVGPEQHEVISTGETPSVQAREADVAVGEQFRAKSMRGKEDIELEQERAQAPEVARVDQRLLEAEQAQRVARMPRDRPVPQPAKGVAERREPLQSEVTGGRPAAPIPEAAPEEPVRLQDFRQAFRDANIEVPSAGQRRRQFNQAYLGITTGKRQPEDILRELEADIRDNNGLMDDLTTRDTPIAETRNLEADIERQTQLADLIAEQHGLERREMAQQVKPVEGEIPEEGASRGGTDIRGMTESQKDDVVRRVARLKSAGTFNPDSEENQRLQSVVDQVEAERTGGEIPAPIEPTAVPGVAKVAQRNAARRAATAAKKTAPAKKAAPTTPVKPTEEMTPEERTARLREILRGENVPGEEVTEEADPLESMSKVQLVEEAGRRGISRVPSSWNKTQIKDAIRKGEVKAKAAPATKATSAEATEAGDLEGLLKSDLLSMARGRDIEVKDWWTKDRIKQAIRGEATPAKKAAPPAKKAAFSEADIQSRLAEDGATVVPTATPAEASPTKAVPSSGSAESALAQLSNIDNPMTREAAGEFVGNMGKAQLRAIAKRLMVPNSSGMDERELRQEIVEATAGRLQDAAATRGFRGRGPGMAAVPRVTAPEAPERPRLAQVAEGLNLEANPADTRLMAALQEKFNGTNTIYKGNDLGRPLTQSELADEVEGLLETDQFGPARQARSVAARIMGGGDEGGAGAKRIDELHERDRNWRRLVNRLRGRHQETGITNPAATRRMSAQDRKGAFEDAWDTNFHTIGPDTAARRSMLEVRDDVASGKITPEEGVRRLESDIEFNKEELASIAADIRNTDNPREVADLRKQHTSLGKDIRFQERASTFIRNHFRDAPEVTPDEVKQALPEPVRKQLDAATPEQLKETAKLTGMPEPKGDTKEEMADDLLGMLAKESVAKKAAPTKRVGFTKSDVQSRLAERGMTVAPAKKAAPPAPEVRPTPPTSRYQRLDINAIGEGLDLNHPDDQKVLKAIQANLDGEKQSPAMIGRNLLQAQNSPSGLRTRAGLATGEEADQLIARANEMEKLGERLQRTRRKANPNLGGRETFEKIAPTKAAPMPEPAKVTPDEKQDLAKAAELTGIPVERLERRAEVKKIEDAPPSPVSQQTADVLKTIDDEQEQRVLLNKKLKSELVDIAKAMGIKVLSKDTKPVIAGKIIDKRKGSAPSTASASVDDQVRDLSEDQRAQVRRLRELGVTTVSPLQRELLAIDDAERGIQAPSPVKSTTALTAPKIRQISAPVPVDTTPPIPSSSITGPFDLVKALNENDSETAIRNLLKDRKFTKQFLTDALGAGDIRPSKGSRSTREDLVGDLVRNTGSRRPATLETPASAAPVKAAKKAAPPKELAEKYKNVTPQRIRNMDDVELQKFFEFEMRREIPNEERLLVANGEMEKRERLSEEEAALREVAQAPLLAQVDELVASGELDYRDAYARVFDLDAQQVVREDLLSQLDRVRAPGDTREDTLKRMYKENVAISYVEAEAATNGHMLNPAGRAANIDPFSLFTGNRARAEKYASDELKDFWDTKGRQTYTAFRGMMTGAQKDVAATRAAKEGERGFRR